MQCLELNELLEVEDLFGNFKLFNVQLEQEEYRSSGVQEFRSSGFS